MNLDKKLELAHEYVKIILDKMLSGDIDILRAEEIAYDAWEYADAMEAEYNKRKEAQKELDAQESKIMFEKLTKEEWQPDWSVAPENYKWAGVTADHAGDITGTIFFVSKPNCSPKSIYSYYIGGGDSIFNEATFGYKGKWQNSLRKRP